MKKLLRQVLIVGITLFILPLVIIYGKGYGGGILLREILEEESKGKQESMKDIINTEVLVGILAKEIPYTYENEAIKAQAVVVRTYMARRILGIQNKGLLTGYTIEELKELWGDRFDEMYEIYEQAAMDTAYEIIFYKNQPIEALYHGASGGMTRDAVSVYGQEVPYLKNVESSVDTVSKQVQMKKEDIVAILKEKYPDLIVDTKSLQNQIQIIQKDVADYVQSLQVGNITIKGETFRELLGLPSSNFKIYDHEESLIFDVRGIGHGVGLSQNGANELAKQGMDYQQIINYYYTDVTIEKYEI